MPPYTVGRGYFPLCHQGHLRLCSYIKGDQEWELLFWYKVAPLYEVEKVAVLPQLHNSNMVARNIHQFPLSLEPLIHTKSLHREVPVYMMNTFTLVTTAWRRTGSLVSYLHVGLGRGHEIKRLKTQFP